MQALEVTPDVTKARNEKSCILLNEMKNFIWNSLKVIGCSTYLLSLFIKLSWSINTTSYVSPKEKLDDNDNNTFKKFVIKFFNVKLALPKRVVKLATVVEGDQKAPFSIATTPQCRGGRYSFPWIAPSYPWYVPYIAEC